MTGSPGRKRGKRLYGIERDDPYGAFNFVVDIQGAVDAGFREVSGLGMAIDVIEYRNGNEPVTRKLPGLHRYQNVVLRRGVIGSLDFYGWIDDVRRGNLAARDVGIALLDENRAEVTRWNLTRAWPARYEGPTMNASSSQVAVEESVLTYESLEVQ